jgi:hypothetical protein
MERSLSDRKEQQSSGARSKILDGLFFGEKLAFDIKKQNIRLIPIVAVIPNSECIQKHKKPKGFTGKGFAMKISN